MRARALSFRADVAGIIHHAHPFLVNLASPVPPPPPLIGKRASKGGVEEIFQEHFSG